MHHRHWRAVGDEVGDDTCVVRAQVEFGQVARRIDPYSMRSRLVEAGWSLGCERIAVPVPHNGEDSVRLGSRLGHCPGYGSGRSSRNVVNVLRLALWDIRGDKVYRDRARCDYPTTIQGRALGVSERKIHADRAILRDPGRRNSDDQTGTYEGNQLRVGKHGLLVSGKWYGRGTGQD